MSKNDHQETYDERREYRRKRRKRNQLICILSLVLIFALIAGGAFFGLSKVLGSMRIKKQSMALQEQIAMENEAEEPAVIEAPVEEEPTPEPEVDYLGDIVESCISEMTIPNKVAALFMITPESLTNVDPVLKCGDTTRKLLGEYPVGGLVYFSKNIQSESQLQELLSATGNCYRIFLAIDEEGGEVSRLASAGLMENVGPMAEIGATEDPEAARTAGALLGTTLAYYGFNVDLAPVADVNREEGSAIGNRSFGTDPVLVSQMVQAQVEGMQNVGVSACLKHFPGIGDATDDMHSGAATSERTKEEFDTIDVLPFKAGIEAGVEFIMVSHLVVPNIAGNDIPSSLNPVIMTDILRGELGYEGIIITDALNMEAITSQYESGEAVVMAIQAGADMVLMPEDFFGAYKAVLEAVENGVITEDRLDESLRRIYRVKYKEKVESE